MPSRTPGRTVMPAAKSAPLDAASSVLPSSLELVLKMPLDIEGRADPKRWEPPKGTMLPEVIEKGRKVIEARLAPCGADNVGQILAPLMITLRHPGTDGMPEEHAAAYYSVQRERYAELLKHVPTPILKRACIAHERLSNFFPTAHELLIHAEPEIANLRQQLRWLDRIPVTGQAKSKEETVQREPAHVRLLTTLKWQEKPGSNLYSVDKASKTRRELAKLAEDERVKAVEEGRPVEEWATLDYAAGLPAAPPEPEPLEPSARVGTFKSAGAAAAKAIVEPSRQLSPESQAALKRSLARQHRAQGRGGYADHLEREADVLAPLPPDERTDIPEKKT